MLRISTAFSRTPVLSLTCAIATARSKRDYNQGMYEYNAFS
jgi:hypothetical protein